MTMLIGEDTCRVCGSYIRAHRVGHPRYVCCDGHDCGCGGACLPHDICSLHCYETAEFEDDEEDGNLDLEDRLEGAFERAGKR